MRQVLIQGSERSCTIPTSRMWLLKERMGSANVHHCIHLMPNSIRGSPSLTPHVGIQGTIIKLEEIIKENVPDQLCKIS
jgi:hypothetical protein